MIRFRSRRFCRSNSKVGGGGQGGRDGRDCISSGDIKWELRPGGMLVQKRENEASVGEGMVTVKVWSGSHLHDVSIEATSTFGQLKMILALITDLEPKEQRLLFKGKEREDDDFLHMVGVEDMDKVLLFEDPANKHRKLVVGKNCRTIIV
ncbi:BAG family molecular chaperone regulator 2-like [Magnolia sinica]|uniref:BAG family molecular chaperone regulator 2-like n=1 Tax=Magnolia sinica TaxID=86752 RepID=UPI00265A2EFF|nr:BAG family molecular chaperone regulator 2-like [Magnolia sinica]